MWEEELRRHEAEQIADAKKLTMEESFREGVQLSVVARKLWLASPFREAAQARIDEADRLEHLAELFPPTAPHA